MKPNLLIVAMLLFSFFSVGQKDSTKIDEYVHKYVEVVAEFPGGQAALNQFIATNFIYPKIAIENNITGKVYVVFEILASGKVSNIKIAKGIPDCYECSEEAIRVLKSMPLWKPAMKDGKPVSSYFKLPITISNN